MGKIFFYRERNALSIKNAILRDPSQHELEEELIKKLEQKAGRIEIAADNQKMREYLENKLKVEGSRFTKFKSVPSDKEAKEYMTRNISIDIAQVLKDMSECFDLKLSYVKTKNLTEIEISQKFYELCKKFKNSNKKQEIFNKICENYVNYLNIFNYNQKEIEMSRVEKEIREGSFLKGKFVTIQ